MTTLIGYGKEWNALAGSVLGEMSAKAAAKRHGDAAYAAVLEDESGGLVSVVVRPSGGRVTFWDGSRTEEAEIHFYDADGADWRLTKLERRNGAARTDRDRAISDWFVIDGDEVQWQRFDAADPAGRVVERRTVAERDALVRPAPAFGEYDYLVVPDLLTALWPGVEPLPWLGP